MSKFINLDQLWLIFTYFSVKQHKLFTEIFSSAIITIFDYYELVLAFFQYKNEMKALRDAHLIFKILSL